MYVKFLSKNQPVLIQPGVSSDVLAFNNNWHQTLFGSFRPCPYCMFVDFISTNKITIINFI